LRGAAHHGLLVRVLDQAHLVERAAQVALLLGAQRAVAHAGAHRFQPAVDAAVQPRWVANGYQTTLRFSSSLGRR
jgi:hypothetical protein